MDTFRVNDLQLLGSGIAVALEEGMAQATRIYKRTRTYIIPVVNHPMRAPYEYVTKDRRVARRIARKYGATFYILRNQ